MLPRLEEHTCLLINTQVWEAVLEEVRLEVTHITSRTSKVPKAVLVHLAKVQIFQPYRAEEADCQSHGVRE